MLLVLAHEVLDRRIDDHVVAEVVVRVGPRTRRIHQPRGVVLHVGVLRALPARVHGQDPALVGAVGHQGRSHPLRTLPRLPETLGARLAGHHRGERLASARTHRRQAEQRVRLEGILLREAEVHFPLVEVKRHVEGETFDVLRRAGVEGRGVQRRQALFPEARAELGRRDDVGVDDLRRVDARADVADLSAAEQVADLRVEVAELDVEGAALERAVDARAEPVGLDFLGLQRGIVDAVRIEAQLLGTRVGIGRAGAAAEVIALREFLTDAGAPDEAVVEQVVEILPARDRELGALQEVELRLQVGIDARGGDLLVRHAVDRGRVVLRRDVLCAHDGFKVIVPADPRPGIDAEFLVPGRKLRALAEALDRNAGAEVRHGLDHEAHRVTDAERILLRAEDPAVRVHVEAVAGGAVGLGAGLGVRHAADRQPLPGGIGFVLGGHGERTVGRRVQHALRDAADLRVDFRILQLGRLEERLGLKADVVGEVGAERRVELRVLGVVQVEDVVVRKRVTEVDRRQFDAELELRDRVDLPAVLAADQVVGVREVVAAAQFEHHVVVGAFAEDLVRVRLVGATVEHHAVFAGVVDRERGVAVHLTGLERTPIGPELALELALGLLVAHRDDAEAAVAAVIEALSTAEDLDTLDHARINGRRTPEVLEGRSTIESGHAVQQQQRIAIGAAIDADGELALVRRIADVGAADQAGGELAEIGEAAGVDLRCGDELHLAAELGGRVRRRGQPLVDPPAFDHDFLQGISRRGIRVVGGRVHRQRRRAGGHRQQGGCKQRRQPGPDRSTHRLHLRHPVVCCCCVIGRAGITNSRCNAGVTAKLRIS